MKKRIIKRNYVVDEKLLSLVLLIDNLVFESSTSYPEEIRKYTLDYLKKLKAYIGMEEKKYINWSIKNIKYNVEYEFEEDK